MGGKLQLASTFGEISILYLSSMWKKKIIILFSKAIYFKGKCSPSLLLNNLKVKKYIIDISL